MDVCFIKCLFQNLAQFSIGSSRFVCLFVFLLLWLLPGRAVDGTWGPGLARQAPCCFLSDMIRRTGRQLLVSNSVLLKWIFFHGFDFQFLLLYFHERFLRNHFFIVCMALHIFVYICTCAHVCACTHVCIWRLESLQIFFLRSCPPCFLFLKKFLFYFMCTAVLLGCMSVLGVRS